MIKPSFIVVPRCFQSHLLNAADLLYVGKGLIGCFTKLFAPINHLPLMYLQVEIVQSHIPICTEIFKLLNTFPLTTNLQQTPLNE